MSTRGAEFRKTDIQIHSPRDAGWVGSRPEDGLAVGATATDVQAVREQYCRSFVAKCIENGLSAISITDHHEGVYVYEVIRTLEKLQTECPEIDLWVFPGMELTCRDSSQALVIFDADLPQVLFEKARAKLNLPADVKPLESRGIQVELLGHNIEELQDLLAADRELKGRFIILPHVKPGGHKTVLRVGFHKRFNEMPYVGGYMDQCYPDNLNPGDRRILDGEIPAWASEKRGVICCSDARHSDFRLIGSYATWIKMASPTAESLRQAMLAPDSRVRYDEPNLPAAVISSVTVKGSKYLADGRYLFNQQMNSVIGGRGAGKSTLLEYARFALGCSALDDETSSSQSTARLRLQEILEGTLDKEEGEICLDVLLNRTPVKVTRSIRRKNVIKVETEGAENLSTVDDVRKLIPTQQYRQGELSDLSRGDAEARLLGLITAQASQQLNDIQEHLKKNAQSLSEVLAKAVRLSAAKQAHAHAKTQTNLLRSQIENLRKELTSKGQTPTPAVTDHEKYVRQQTALDAARNFIEQNKINFEKAFGNFFEDLSEVIEDQPIFKDLPELSKVFSSLDGSRTLEDDALKKVEEYLSNWFNLQIAQIEKAESEWKPVRENHETEYAEQKSQLAGKQNVIESIEVLIERERLASKQLDSASSEVSELHEADDQLQKLRDERQALEAELFNVVGEQISRIEEASSGLARGTIASQPDFYAIDSAIRKTINLPHLREARLDGLLRKVKNADDKPKKWREIQDETLMLLKWKEGAPEEKGQPPATPLLRSALGNEFMEKLCEKISIDGVSVILRAILRPRAEISHIRDGIPIEFRKASQGEQAATLLNILMNQSHGPLIVDQPEEDLDNKIINEIIKTIRKAKDLRQLILATHNANIAVNGDSENVIEMVHGKQLSGGAIDEPSVRVAITETMEGGKDAFELRRKKYNF